MKLHTFMTSSELCGAEFTGDSWAVHREVIARLWDGDAHLIPAEHRAIAQQLLGSELLPSQAPDEMYLAFGRRSGKTKFMAACAVHAWAQDYRKRGLSLGEVATVSIHAVDKRQAGVAFGYCEGLIRASPMLFRGVKGNITATQIESKHSTRIEIFTSNFRSARGYSMPLACLDEAAFMADEYSAKPDAELRRSLLPALATLHGRLLVASSLHRRAGLMYDMHKRHFGKVAA